MFKKLLALILVAVSVFCMTACKDQTGETVKIKNVIILIGDGMGPNQIRFGELYKGEKLFMQSLTNRTFVETYSANAEVTDSSASATAIATGVKINNSQVGITPQGEELETIVDYAKSLGKKTGIITTEELYGATPMGFSAHSTARGNYDELLVSAATTSNVDLFASYTLPRNYSACIDRFVSEGYTLISDVDQISESVDDKIIGTYPILASMPSMDADDFAVAFDRVVIESLEYLSKDEDGFFLMAEGAHIDHGGHNNDVEYMVRELLAFDDMVKAVVNWAKERKDTLVLVTADHETGGLMISDDATSENLFKFDDYGYMRYGWTTGGHTKTNVYLYAYGANVDFKKYSEHNTNDKVNNTDIIKIMKEYLNGVTVNK